METDYIKLGNCIELLKEIQDNSIDVVFTSPPYNSKRHKKYDHYEDNIEDYHGMLCDVTNECLRVTKKWVIVNIQANYYNKTEIYKYIGTYSDKIQRIVIWEKSNPTPSYPHQLTNSYEYFIILGDVPVKTNSVSFKDVIHSSVNSNKFKGHSAVMNKDVCDLFIREFTQKGDLVLDPFLGSGTTAVSCIDLDRHYIGYEISKDYFEIAEKRISDALKDKECRGEQITFDELFFISTVCQSAHI